MTDRWSIVRGVLVLLLAMTPPVVIGGDLPVAEGVRVVEVGTFKLVECPAAWELPDEALSGSWSTQAMSNYRCEFHADVSIRQIEVTADEDRFDVRFVIEQEEGTDKEVDLEVTLLDADGYVLDRGREQIELDEGEITRERIRVRLPKGAAGRAAHLRLTIHGIGWG